MNLGIGPEADANCIPDRLDEAAGSVAFKSCGGLTFESCRYKPVTFEFARCNVQQSVLSKRRLMDLVSKSLVQGWDDPRLLTLRGLRYE